MKSTKEYIEGVLTTESAKELNLSVQQSRLLHGAMGVSTEAGELLDALKKHLFYDAPLNMVNIKEELGDLLWYIGIMIDTLNTTYLEIMDMNMKKLKKRYPDGKFNKDDAMMRDVKHELSHFDTDSKVFKASKCPKCNINPQVSINMDHSTGKHRTFVYCPECSLSAPDGKDFIKEIAVDEGIKEWEKLLKEKSSSQE